jgi:hypothetical protein
MARLCAATPTFFFSSIAQGSDLHINEGRGLCQGSENKSEGSENKSEVCMEGGAVEMELSLPERMALEDLQVRTTCRAFEICRIPAGIWQPGTI